MCYYVLKVLPLEGNMNNEHIIYTSPKATIKVQNPRSVLLKGPLSRVHFHAELEILYVTRGSLQYHVDNKLFPAKAGDVVFVNTQVPHFGEILEDNTTFIMIQFLAPTLIIDPSITYLAKYLFKTDYPCHVFKMPYKDATLLSNLIEEINENHNLADRAHEYLIIAKKYEILHFLYKNEYLADESNLLKPINLDAILPIVEFINDNYQRQINLYDISKHLCLHRNYLCRLFKQATGKTVMDYLNFVRMCNAEILLKSNKSIAEIAELTGFSSPEYFNKVFKNHFFYTPSEYRNKYLKSNHIQ